MTFQSKTIADRHVFWKHQISNNRHRLFLEYELGPLTETLIPGIFGIRNPSLQIQILPCSLNYTSNISSYSLQNLVLEFISKLRASKITFDLGFRIKYLYYARQSCWLLNLMVQIYNYITSKIALKWNVFWHFITMMLRPKLRLKLIWIRMELYMLQVYYQEQKHFTSQKLFLEIILGISPPFQKVADDLFILGISPSLRG